MLKVWFIDDLQINQLQWLNSFAPQLREQHSFEVFTHVEELFETLDTGRWPDILFVDYFIGKRYGHEVIAYFQDYHQRPFLIAHSSMSKANQAMLEQGADLMLEKINNVAITQSIAELIQTEQDLYQLLGRGQGPDTHPF